MPRLTNGTANAGHRDNVYQRGDRWYVRFTVDGKEIRRSAGRSKAAAQLLLAKLREDAERGLVGLPKKNRLTFGQWAPRFLDWSKRFKRSWQRDEQSLGYLVKAFGEIRLPDITKERVEAYQRDRLAEKRRGGPTKKGDAAKADAGTIKGSTVNREVACLRKALAYAVERGELDVNPLTGVRMLPESPARQPILEPEDERRLLAACSPDWFRRMVRLAIASGLREGELIALRWRDFDFEEGEVIVRDSKSGESRRVPVGAEVLEEVRAQRQHPEAMVFPGADGGPMVQLTVVKAFVRARTKIGRPDLRFHDLRHVAGSRLLAAGANLPEVADWLGHRTLIMAKRYAHTNRSRLRALVNSVPVTSAPATVEGAGDGAKA